ncbi:MAG TPA: UDP-N-acetylglucosamine 2-epimerase (non-hydrolyzing) [Gemmatimonadaceae bacterium]|nr:UDP-N-acetylglucosamine 2-epimerase (non-hydrolyzing) [Gemmatimonadaceae bacterium]
MSVDVLLVAGARPNFVKLAPLYRALQRHAALRTAVLHTGQHYDDAMSGSFFRELGIPEPEVNLEVGPGTHAVQTATIMQRFEPVLTKLAPRWVVVFGDVNSTVACALVAAKLGVKVAHVEAGLRSNDWTMPEEINRVVTDRLAQRLYTPSRDASANLEREGIPAERIVLVGNIMVDTLRMQLPQLDQPAILRDAGVEREHYVLVTLHRPSNVDDSATLGRICEVLQKAADRETILFPAHPRTRARLQTLVPKRTLRGVRVIDPLPYRTFLGLMANARVVVTDSGGIQEETTALGIPCLTLRRNTERPITITEGTNQLVEPDPEPFDRALHAANGRRHRIPELWDGHTAERISDDLVRHAAA